MTSITYVTQLTAALVTLMTIGIGFRCVQIVINGLHDGEDFPSVVKKIRKKIFALMACVCTGALIAIIQMYY